MQLLQYSEKNANVPAIKLCKKKKIEIVNNSDFQDLQHQFCSEQSFSLFLLLLEYRVVPNN